MYKKLLFLIITLSSLLRLGNLGYSNFQGDEISAQNYLFGEERIIPFLLSRTVGPLQYIVSYLTNIIASLGNLDKELFVRLPFALAGIFAIYAMYRLCEKHLSREVALISATLLSLSGLYIAFARIVQYQSFVILLSLCTVYIFLSYLRAMSNIKLIYIGVLSGVSLLFHYDSISFILPIYLVLIVRNNSFRQKLSDLFYVSTPFMFLVSLFYIPFVLQPSFKSTLLYLANERIRSEFNYDSLYYSVKLMGIYHPKEYLALFLILIVMLIIYLFRSYESVIQRSTLVLLVFAIVARVYAVDVTPILLYFSTILGCFYLALLFWKKPYRENITSGIFVTTWFLVAFIAYGLFFQKPLTHIYNFLTPLFILFGIVVAKQNGLAKKLILVSVTVVGIIGLSFNYQAFIDTTPEYPWNTKKYISGTMDDSLAQNQGVMGVFGFPYNRNWVEIGQKLHELEIERYKSNEKYRLSKYYVQSIAWDDFEFEAFVWIDKPQSFDRQPRPTQDILAEDDDYVIYQYKPEVLYDTAK